ncbi:hypothetical protein ASPVEDRAFT_155585 [Aspergillus versicolor CBS 583.65]|uniref:Zn(2)-C6 fungal-type domain-containing protein n=1 Tax=Aspergillus versicolor CBS 583.65 TaxID=1036611 RepID=A0A1L9Q251_ASPVE|nr:uncharacterized protein ASPVEDRAFT_155585 [Aspergillus versicolor CBS 583.65]OJJ07818.1 hypothetical protein ASPVEDRAFT_155585 [Aspergillus versicolor CBS 583.65]
MELHVSSSYTLATNAMDVDPKFICPRPRNPRACSNCRSRKIRCFPGKDQNEKACRRCTKFGYTCSYTNSSRSRPQPGISSQSLNGSPQHDGDIISGLFRDRPPLSGGVDQVMDLHRRVFQEQSHQESPPDPISIPTPESVGPSQAKEDTSINMREADKLLSLFRKRSSYFPFIYIPDSTSAAAMAVHQPFLLLAILTVSSSRTPRLQQQTDERFRRVMSERVIVHGEKGLDYVQGLLVYIAWYPLYLRPLRNQTLQYLQIVSTMISDLGLDLSLEEESEGRNASLGCHTLCTLMFSIGRRSYNVRTRMGAYLQASSKLDRNDLAMQHLRIQDLSGRVARYKASVRETTKTASGSTDEEPSISLEEVCEKMVLFTHELEDLYYGFPAETRSSISIRLTRQFIKVTISSLPSFTLNQTPSITDPATTDLTHATSHFTEIQSFLELFLSIPPDEYTHFSIREWSQLIIIISLTSELCFFQVPFLHIQELIQRTTWVEFQTQTRAKMLIYLESLTHRMGTLSVSSSSTYPDSFYMFASVLGILVRTYTPAATCPLNTPSGTEIQNGDPGMSSSRCPVLNGSIQETDFWRALERNAPVSGSYENTGNGEGNVPGGLDLSDLVNHPQDWPSVFEEWVVDLNNLPE